MDLRQIRWPIIILVGVVLCGTLWFGGEAFKTLTVTRPLKNAMASAESVEAVDTINGVDGLTILLTVKKEADLQTAYEAALAKAGLKAQTAVAKVEVKDSADPVLAKLYRERIAFLLQEAIATGRYGGLPAQVKAATEAAGAQATLTIDENHLYLTLRQGDLVLYKVVSRAITTKTGGETL